MNLDTVTPLGGSRNTYATLAEDAIRAMILDGRLAAGVRVNEVELADSLQISRGPLREAIQRLASQGMLTTKSHRGAYVREISTDELRDLYELRAALEVYALRKVAAQADPDTLARLADLLKQTKKLAKGPTDADGAQLEFHRHLAEASGNRALRRAHSVVLQQIALARARAVSDDNLVHHALEQHVDVLEPLLAGDVESAGEALEEHLDNTLTEGLAMLTSVRPSDSGG